MTTGEAVAVEANGAAAPASQQEEAPSQQDRLLFFASVLIGHKVEVQVRAASLGGRGRGRKGREGEEVAPPALSP